MAWHSGASTERSRGSRTVAVTSASMASWNRDWVRPPVTVYGRTSRVEPSSSAPKPPPPKPRTTLSSHPPAPRTPEPCQEPGAPPAGLTEPANGDRSSPRPWPATRTSGHRLIPLLTSSVTGKSRLQAGARSGGQYPPGPFDQQGHLIGNQPEITGRG